MTPPAPATPPLAITSKSPTEVPTIDNNDDISNDAKDLDGNDDGTIVFPDDDQTISNDPPAPPFPRKQL